MSMVDELHILQHCLGLNSKGQGRQYRNSFPARPGRADHPVCMALVEKGFMKRLPGNGGDDIFYATEAGIACARAASMKGAKT